MTTELCDDDEFIVQSDERRETEKVVYCTEGVILLLYCGDARGHCRAARQERRGVPYEQVPDGVQHQAQTVICKKDVPKAACS